MRRTIISAIVGLLLISMLSIAAASESQLMRVGILRDVSEVTISAAVGFDIIDLQSGVTIASDLDSIVLQPGHMGIRLVGEDQEYFQIALKPYMPEGIRLNYLEVGGNSYRGNMEVRRSAAGKLTVINELSVEDYVKGVVSKEMLARFEPEALKAQAVIARTYGLHHLKKHGSEGFDVCTTTHCQSYGGVRAETTATNRAVAETQGEVLTYNGQLINAVFHCSSGDYTENNENVWFTKDTKWGQPYLRGVPDFDQDSKYASWEKTLTLDEVTQMLAEKGLDIGEFEGIDITERGVSGQVKWATILGSRGQQEVMGEQLRSDLGLFSGKVEIIGGNVQKQIITEETVAADKLRTRQRVVVQGGQNNKLGQSLENKYVLGAGDELHKIGTARIFAYPFFKTTAQTTTVIDEDANTITFKGKGKGHGVGLSQWGAQGMAKQGYKYEEILKHYYTGVELETIDS